MRMRFRDQAMRIRVHLKRRATTAAGVALTGVLVLLGSSAAAAAEETVTFSKDVVPILQAKCQQCHRPGQMAPFSLMTYQDARPRARSIKQKVVAHEMPPWFIDKSVGIQKFENDTSLSDKEVATIAKWVDGGAPEGNPADMPRARTFEDSGLAKPDLVVSMGKEHRMYARGFDWWPTFIADTGLTEDRWVKAFEIKPGNPRIVHHACLGAIPPPGPKPEGAAGV